MQDWQTVTEKSIKLIKVVSPKYLGDRVSEKVKTKIIELLYSWTLALPEESKIKDAYHMLKRQGMCPPSLSLHAA